MAPPLMAQFYFCYHTFNATKSKSSKNCLPMTYLSSLGEGLRNFAVSSSVTGGDEVSYTTALQEGCRGDGPLGAEDAREGDHFHQAQPDHCCLGVVAVTQSVTKARTNSHYVLQKQCVFIMTFMIKPMAFFLVHLNSIEHSQFSSTRHCKKRESKNIS